MEEAVAIRVGGTVRLRYLAMLAVVRRFGPHFLIGIAAWILLGLYWGEGILHAKLMALLIFPIALNILGIDPGQLVMRGVVTLTPTEVYWTNILGKTHARGWAWVRRAEDVRGDLHIVFGRHRTRAVAFKHAIPVSTYQRLRRLLVMNGKLPD